MLHLSPGRLEVYYLVPCSSDHRQGPSSLCRPRCSKRGRLCPAGREGWQEGGRPERPWHLDKVCLPTGPYSSPPRRHEAAATGSLEVWDLEPAWAQSPQSPHLAPTPSSLHLAASCLEERCLPAATNSLRPPHQAAFIVSESSPPVPAPVTQHKEDCGLSTLSLSVGLLSHI